MPDQERASTPAPADALSTAIDAAKREPAKAAHWELVEELVDSAQRPSDVRALFHDVLAKKDLGAALAVDVGQRAVRFYEAWYGEDSVELPQLLARVLDIDPGAQWAFERMTVALTVAERWDDLLAAYDRAIERADNTARRMKLLDEAAQAAKDFAAAPDRAIGYMSQLFALDPDNAALAASLERLLERQGRWKDLIELWGSRIDMQPAKQQRDTRLRMAACQLDSLHDHAAALGQIELVLKDAPEYKPAFDLLEKVLAADAAAPEQRRRALSLLKDYFIKRQKPRDVVAVLERGLSFATDAERRSLLRELVERWLDLREEARAMQHQAALLVIEPMPKERDALRALAERTRDFERYATALVEAAAACSEPATRVELLAEAARLREESLGQIEPAIELYKRVFEAGAGVDATVAAGRRLVKLLEQTERERETLDVLSRMSELEPVEAVRRGMLGKIAQLADKLGDKERARQAWRSRVGDDSSDIEALEALIQAAARDEDHAGLAKLLRQRAAAPAAAHQRRSDLVWLAKICADKLQDLGAAIDTWRQVRAQYGEDAEAVNALTELLSRAERWPELAEVLSQAAAGEVVRFTELQTQLGDAYRERLGKPEEAVKRYRVALQVDASHARAREGQRALLADERCRAPAVESLADAYAHTDEWRNTLSVLEQRLVALITPAERASVLVEAAKLYEERAKDQSSALECYRRAFTLTPDNRATEREIRRLALELGRWDAAVASYRETIATFARLTPRVAELRYDEGVTLETRVGDREGALVAFTQAAKITPDRLEFASAAARLAATLGRWDVAAAQVLGCAASSAGLPPTLLAAIEEAALESQSWELLCDALTKAVSFAADAISPSVARDLHARVALLLHERCKDEKGAEAALLRAVQADPTHRPSLSALAELQRATPSVALLDTLHKLAELDRDNLDPLREAAEVAIDRLRDDARGRDLLEALYARALPLWRRGRKAAGSHEPQPSAVWAVEHLSELHMRQGEAAAALELLVDASSLPFDAETTLGMRQRAAELARGPLSDVPRAIALYRDILARDPRDARAIEALAELYALADRLPELLMLRRHELDLDISVDRRLSLRLELARLLGEMEARGDRVASLEANLAERPGHKPSLEAISSLLRGQGRFAQLATVFEAQARALGEQGRSQDAAWLWRELAKLRERELHDVMGAMAAYRELHTLEPYGDASEALARLLTSLGDHAGAAEWLEIRLGTAPPDTRAITAVDLARAHIEAGQTARARGCLEQALAQEPAVDEARDLLAQLYRQEGQHELLARLLAQGAEFVTQAERRLAYLREAADLYYEQLGAPDRSIPVLSRAVELAPEDTRLRAMLAEGLRVAGRFDEARAQLKGLIDAFGRRRSPERADLHYQLARVAESAGATEEALLELDQATKMDLAHQAALHMLARLARDQGDLDRAERAYRGLLLVVRRQKSDDVHALGSSEVFFELYRIAVARGQKAQADELLASAMEGATQSETEARRFTQVLRARGEVDLLLRVLDARISLAREPELLAELLSAKADVLEKDLDKKSEALDTRLRALELDPSSDGVHRATASLAARMDEISRYIDAVTALIDETTRKRMPQSPRQAAQLTLRLGRVIAEQLGDLDRAAGLFARVEGSGECVVESWLAMAQVAGARGDRAEQRRVLARIAELDDSQAEQRERDEARFLLAELELADTQTLDAGVHSLKLALAQSSDYARAKACLTRALEFSADHAGVLAAYEQVARLSRDDLMLLSFLERRSQRDDAQVDDTREGIDLALRIGEVARAEALLTRAAALARASKTAADTTWVFSGLAECRLQAGDVRGALAHLQQALSVASEGERVTLGRELAELAAGPAGDLEVAAQTYGTLLDKDPSDRSLWEPLLAVLIKLKDRKRFEAFVAHTLQVLLPVEDRALLYLAHAKFLVEVVRKDKDAIPVLEQLLEEDATNLEATDRLVGIYQRHGMKDALAEILKRQFDRARDERNVPIITELGLRIGQLYGAAHPTDACDAYRAALQWEPEHRGLLAALIERLPEDADPRERAELMQRLLGSESGAAAAELALQLAEIWAGLSEKAQLQHALELGYRAQPEHDGLRDRLESFYADNELWLPLAQLMVAEAQRLGISMVAVARLKNAATLYRDKLADVEGSAHALRLALQIVPEDLSLLAELARNLAAAGQHDTAISDVSRLVDGHTQRDTGRVDLLRVRADLLSSVARFSDAAADLDEAYSISQAEVAPSLMAALDALRCQARDASDFTTERSASLRLVRVLDAAGHADRAREVLAAWAQRDPSDIEVLRELRARDTAKGRWQAVAQTCAQLISIDHNAARIDAAIGLSEAYEQLGRAQDALAGLLQVHRQEPDAKPIRDRLRALFERLGQQRELAALLLGDAELESDVGNKVALLLRAAQLYLDVDAPETATAPLGQAMELAPDDDRTRLLLVDIQIRLGRTEEATAIVDQAMNAHKRRRSPELAQFQVRMGRICALRGDRASQLKWLNTALDTDRKSGEVASELVEVSMLIEDYDTAMKALRTLSMMEDPKPITRALAFLKQAEIAYARGDSHRAQHWARKAKSLDENLSAADEFLAKVGG
jgi:tetratricopeptide (TPR) repeat protein